MGDAEEPGENGSAPMTTETSAVLAWIFELILKHVRDCGASIRQDAHDGLRNGPVRIVQPLHQNLECCGEQRECWHLQKAHRRRDPDSACAVLKGKEKRRALSELAKEYRGRSACIGACRGLDVADIVGPREHGAESQNRRAPESTQGIHRGIAGGVLTQATDEERNCSRVAQFSEGLRAGGRGSQTHRLKKCFSRGTMLMATQVRGNSTDHNGFGLLKHRVKHPTSRIRQRAGKGSIRRFPANYAECVGRQGTGMMQCLRRSTKRRLERRYCDLAEGDDVGQHQRAALQVLKLAHQASRFLQSVNHWAIPD